MCNKKISVILEKEDFFVETGIVTAVLQNKRNLSKPLEIQRFHVLRSRNPSGEDVFVQNAQKHLEFTIIHVNFNF